MAREPGSYVLAYKSRLEPDWQVSFYSLPLPLISFRALRELLPLAVPQFPHLPSEQQPEGPRRAGARSLQPRGQNAASGGTKGRLVIIPPTGEGFSRFAAGPVTASPSPAEMRFCSCRQQCASVTYHSDSYASYGNNAARWGAEGTIPPAHGCKRRPTLLACRPRVLRSGADVPGKVPTMEAGCKGPCTSRLAADTSRSASGFAADPPDSPPKNCVMVPALGNGPSLGPGAKMKPLARSDLS